MASFSRLHGGTGSGSVPLKVRVRIVFLSVEGC